MSTVDQHIMVSNGSLMFQNGAVKVDKEAMEQSTLKTGISKPHPHDILSGRGNSINSHPGNQYFRSLVKHVKNEYVVTPKPEKPLFAKLIVKHIQALEPPGRFLEKESCDLWYDIGEKIALNKTRAALRMDAEKIAMEIEMGQRAVTTNVRTSMTLKAPPTSLVDNNAKDVLLTSFTQLKQQAAQSTSMTIPQPIFSHSNGSSVQGGRMVDESRLGFDDKD